MNQAVAQFAPLLLIMVVFYFLIMRPQQKKFKAHQAMLAALKVGDKVVLAAGFKGRVTKVGEQFYTVDIGKVRESKWKWNATRLPRKPNNPFFCEKPPHFPSAAVCLYK